MAFDHSELRGRIIEKFGTQKKFAQAMGVSDRTLSLKMNNAIFFRQDEIAKATELLELSISDANEYFLLRKLKKFNNKRG